MGVDLRGFFEHRLSKKEILNLPQTIEQWSDVKALKKPNKHIWANPDAQHQKQLSVLTNWTLHIEPTFFDLETVWDFYEDSTQSVCKVHPDLIRIESFFGSLKIYRHIIEVCQSPEQKYANLQEPETAQMILGINRLIAGKFGASKIIYCPDSGFPTEDILIEARKATSVDQLISNSTKKFFQPPSDIKEAIRYMFFIDEMKQELDDLEEWNWNQIPWTYDEQGRKFVEKD